METQESLKMLQCFGESTLSCTQVYEWHKAISEGREVHENLSHASRPFPVLENCCVGIREIARSSAYMDKFNTFRLLFWVCSMLMLNSY